MSSYLTLREKDHWQHRISVRIDKRIDELRTEKPGFMHCIKSKAKKRVLASYGLLKQQRSIERLSNTRQELEEKRESLRSAAETKKTAVDARMEPKLEAIRNQQKQLDRQETQLRERAAKKKDAIDEQIEPELDELSTQNNALQSKQDLLIDEMVKLLGAEDYLETPSWLRNSEAKIEEMLRPLIDVEIRNAMSNSTRGRKILALENEKDNLQDTVWLATSGKQVKELWDKLESLLGQQPTKLQRDALDLEPVVDE